MRKLSFYNPLILQCYLSKELYKINDRLFYISESSILTKETGVNKNLQTQGDAEDKGLPPPPIKNSQKYLSTNGHLWRVKWTMNLSKICCRQ